MAFKNIPINLIPKGTDRALWKIVDDISIPSGGTAGQALVKLSDSDYDVAWMNVSSGFSGNFDFGTILNPLNGPYTGVGNQTDTDFGSLT